MSGASRRVVYSTGSGQRCPGCGWPECECRCSATPEEPVPTKVVARLRIEKKGRAGKTVTVVDGLPRNTVFLRDLARELKKACGTGGTPDDGAVELQGDCREKVRELLEKKGLVVKG